MQEVWFTPTQVVQHAKVGQRALSFCRTVRASPRRSATPRKTPELMRLHLHHCSSGTLAISLKPISQKTWLPHPLVPAEKRQTFVRLPVNLHVSRACTQFCPGFAMQSVWLNWTMSVSATSPPIAVTRSPAGKAKANATKASETKGNQIDRRDIVDTSRKTVTVAK